MNVADGKVVVIHYTLARQDGGFVESTRGKSPIAYLHGTGGMMKGIEQALADQPVGARLQVTVPPELGFGDRKGGGPVAVPRREFPKETQLAEGMPLRIPGSDGQQVLVWVTKIRGAKVWIDVDHPLAGHTLDLDVEVLHVRDPYPEELEHGHAHGADGDAHMHHG